MVVMDLYSVIYASSATKVMVEAELMDILEVSRRKNAEREITGILLYFEGSFLQLLEGPRPAIEELMATIARDDRHGNIIRLVAEPMTQRSFPQWSMGFQRVDSSRVETDIPGFTRFMENPRLDEAQLAGVSRKAAVFLRTFRVVAGRD